MFRIAPYSSNRRNQDLFDVFDDFFTGNKSYKGAMKIDIQDNEKEYIVEVDVPGIKKENIEIHFESENLIISINEETEKNEDNTNYIHRERFTQSLKRSVFLKDVQPKKMSAKLEDGVLRITAAKNEEKISKYLIDIE